MEDDTLPTLRCANYGPLVAVAVAILNNEVGIMNHCVVSYQVLQGNEV